ncbi:MAG TPA: hypothetical protein VK448_02825 [Dissulfurispiraceae bacterium]|nr:hypothetical protein [Dissulfurispiraceae bacterium]
MMYLSSENIAGLTEVVICDTASALRSHMDLFRYSRSSYISADNFGNAFPLIASLIDACNESESCPARIHLAVGWENMLRAAAWRSDFSSAKDVFIVLKNAGVAESALSLFASAPVCDLFPFLYYGKQLDVLKKICIMARRQIETRIQKSPVRADCHIITEDSPHIVASSL